ncbi:hypothetical protein ACIREK_31095 [Streptomyces sp. NPDC102415]|uniref:hypothetical protein n=1 Tax=Streptomyces sp. NPDC102415 TaxID=3366173 RepID=UPI0037F433A4
MSTDQALRDATRRWARRRNRLIAYGQWQPFVDAEPARQHVLAIRTNTGMSLANLAAATNVGIGTLEHLIYGCSGYPPAAQIRPESASALLAYWPALDDYIDGAVIDATGTRRRMQALSAIGWAAPAVHQRINFVNVRTVANLKGRELVTARVARAVRDFYQAVSGSPAETHGVAAVTAKQARSLARRNQWAAPSAWDDDTIDDPQAIPDWTGHCGTDRGWWMHTSQKLPMCEACQNAHEAWKAEHRVLPREEYMSALFLARAAASTRGAEIAHDGRELMRLGCTTEQAADRLRISKEYLQQELARHPAEQVAA